MAIDDRVAATVALHLAQASLQLAKLEAEEKETPAMSGTSNRRLTLARKLTSARNLVDGWAAAAALVELERQAEADTTNYPSGAPVVPERTVAWSKYVDGGPNVLVCNNRGGLCKHGIPMVYPDKWIALKAIDLLDGGVCSVCGTDVLA